jgi:hypothetical protein
MSMNDQVEEKLNKIMEKYKKERYVRDPALRSKHRYFLKPFVSQISWFSASLRLLSSISESIQG